MYNYDLISGKVNMVMYQRGWADQWFHRYSYDAENRLTMAETSTDSLTWEKEATYEYYRHGPLARTVIGQQQVQGLDYAYTLQGWLKGVNSTGGTETHDMGRDGKVGSMNQYTARDATSFTLNYFAGDYKAISGNVNPFPNYSGYLGSFGHYRPLFNGNISSMSEYNKKFDTEGFANGGLQLYSYRYDQLNRLTGQDGHIGFDTANNNWGNMAEMGGFMTERVAYDANGNIVRYLRNAMGGNSTDMDSLSYYYYPGTNKLRHVRDLVEADAYRSSNDDLVTDIDDQEEENNYEYDAIGNLLTDHAESISNITWSVYGKILQIDREATDRAPVTQIKYTYDAQGNRIGKLYDAFGTQWYTWYVRDAQGNIISTYTAQSNGSLPELEVKQSERYIYGSSRLGMYTPDPLDVDNGQSGPEAVSIPGDSYLIYGRGLRQYELTNHLGNVLATITDKKFGVPSDTNSSFTGYYEPEIVSAFGFYPFGAMSRIYVHTQTPYRFGFNGKELDHEAKGNAVQYDYGMRIYDPRLGRFFSVDPLSESYPWYTPYQFAGNKPIIAIDLDGEEEKVVIHHLAKYPDGQFYVKSSNVNIDFNSRYFDPTGKEKAITNVYAEYGGQTSLVGYREEAIVAGDLKPSAAYDYTDEQGSMRQKEKDDNAYAGSYWNIGKWWKITKRDLNAPDNAMIIQDVQELGNILASQAAASAALKQVQSARTASTQTATKPPTNNPYSRLTRKQILDSKKSYEGLLKEHQQKLKDYIKNPDKYDNLGKLKDVTQEIREKIIQGRIKELNRQIQKHEGELKKINEALNSQ